MNIQDYYRILDVEISASATEIRRSYHRLAHKYHPDISKQLNCEQLFREVTEAYAALKHSHKTSAIELSLKPVKAIEFLQ